MQPPITTSFIRGSDGYFSYCIICGRRSFTCRSPGFFVHKGNSETYKLTIQNQTEYELIGIKSEYKADEEVEVKMIYEDDVCTFAFLDGELLGELTGINSIKFNMPAKDSVLTISYSEKFITVIHPEFIYHFLTGFDSVILSDGKGSASVNKAYSDFSSQLFFDEFSHIEVTVVEDNDDFQMTSVDYHITFNTQCCCTWRKNR